MNKDKLLTLFMGKCWHEWEWIPGNGVHCKLCGHNPYGKENFTYHHLEELEQNPDFSQPAQWHEFFVWLCGKYENLWGEFYEYAHFNFCIDKSREQYDAWLFSDLARFRDLFADFLMLPETIERWGWEECENCNGIGVSGHAFVWPGEVCEVICSVCHGTGTITHPALRKEGPADEVKEATDAEG